MRLNCLLQISKFLYRALSVKLQLHLKAIKIEILKIKQKNDKSYLATFIVKSITSCSMGFNPRACIALSKSYEGYKKYQYFLKFWINIHFGTINLTFSL